MTHLPITTEQMLSDYVLRFRDLKARGIPLMFIDSILPGHQRMNYAVIGDTASENPEYESAIRIPHKFQIGMGFAAPGNGPAFHTHDYVEMFLILKGKWRFYWGNDPEAKPEGEVVLGHWDMITLPPGLYRGFEVVGKSVGYFFAVLDPHTVFHSKDPYWAPHIETLAAEYGFRADERGKMIKPDNYAELRDKMKKKLNRLIEKPAKSRAKTKKRA